MAAQRSAFTGDADEDKRLERLFDDFASTELDRQILAFSQRYDPQTGLLNHHAFQDALAAMLRANPAGEEVALIWIDLVNLRRPRTPFSSSTPKSLLPQHRIASY